MRRGLLAIVALALIVAADRPRSDSGKDSREEELKARAAEFQEVVIRYYAKLQAELDAEQGAQDKEITPRLAVAFGKDSPVAKMPIKIWMEGRGLLLAGREFLIEEDGRIQFTSLRLAVFPRNVPNPKTVDITTLSSPRGYLTFTKPIKTISDLGKHKLVTVEMAGGLQVRIPE
jgi:hypothetical protein